YHLAIFLASFFLSLMIQFFALSFLVNLDLFLFTLNHRLHVQWSSFEIYQVFAVFLRFYGLLLFIFLASTILCIPIPLFLLTCSYLHLLPDIFTWFSKLYILQYIHSSFSSSSFNL